MLKEDYTPGTMRFFNRKGKQVEEIPDGVRVAFADGHIAQGDILIGCDGVFSMVRKNIFPDATKPAYTKDISTGGYARLPELGEPLDAINMTFGKRGFFAYSVSNHGEVW